MTTSIQTQTCSTDLDISSHDQEGVSWIEISRDTIDKFVTGEDGLEECHREDFGGEFAGVDGRRGEDGSEGSGMKLNHTSLPPYSHHYTDIWTKERHSHNAIICLSQIPRLQNSWPLLPNAQILITHKFV